MHFRKRGQTASPAAHSSTSAKNKHTRFLDFLFLDGKHQLWCFYSKLNLRIYTVSCTMLSGLGFAILAYIFFSSVSLKFGAFGHVYSSKLHFKVFLGFHIWSGWVCRFPLQYFYFWKVIFLTGVSPLHIHQTWQFYLYLYSEGLNRDLFRRNLPDYIQSKAKLLALLALFQILFLIYFFPKTSQEMFNGAGKWAQCFQ